ncbi:hypothetical protein [Acidiplasma cupricumulans]|uniref:urease accessory protein UreE n=1 Tax=Acidiplasma cupricumulans TaxID=312540 RepID=UPI000784FABC|nr:hypothetical protein [Acidiplasma cupricumulans]
MNNNEKIKNIRDVKVNRQDTMRGRIRLEDVDNEEIIIDLPRGQIINNGDIFGPTSNGTFYRINIMPEPVIKVTIETNGTEKDYENFLTLGYNLGNHHMEVLIEGRYAYVTTGIGVKNVNDILKKIPVPIVTQLENRVISTIATGYHAGEDKE